MTKFKSDSVRTAQPAIRAESEKPGGRSYEVLVMNMLDVTRIASDAKRNDSAPDGMVFIRSGTFRSKSVV